MTQNDCPWCDTLTDDLHDDLWGEYCGTCVATWTAQYPDWSCGCTRCDRDLDDTDLGSCEDCGHIDDWDALHSATAGVYCDACADPDGWACDCEPCLKARQAGE